MRASVFLVPLLALSLGALALSLLTLDGLAEERCADGLRVRGTHGGEKGTGALVVGEAWVEPRVQ